MADKEAATFLGIRATDALTKKFHDSGWWGGNSPMDDLDRWRSETPDAVAVFAHRADSGIRTITYREYADHVDRFAGALHELGVRPGQVVAIQLPNWWQMGALWLACARLGAVLAPLMTSIRPRELERILTRLEAKVVVTVDRWAGFDHPAALAELVPRLPHLRHRVVLHSATTPAEVVDEADREIDFDWFFQQTPWEDVHAAALEAAQPDPDRVFLVLFTSGTSGEPKAVLHTINTRYGSYRPFTEVMGLTGRDRMFTPQALTHGVGSVTCIVTPLLLGASAVIMDVWEPETGLALMAETGVSYVIAVPVFLASLVAAAEVRKRALPALRTVVATGTAAPRELVADVPRVLGLPLQVLWGMTEIGYGACSQPDDPLDWATRSVGRPIPGLEVDFRADHEVTAEQPARLLVRGPRVGVATVGRDSGEVVTIAEHDDGWYDTGDLAVPDGRGGIRLAGRASDRIGGAFMIPVNDVESALRAHPGVEDVALVGYPDGAGGELACAVITTCTTPPPALADLREFLTAQGMTEWYQPSRVEVVAQLPRNPFGKVQKELIRQWIRGEAALPGK